MTEDADKKINIPTGRYYLYPDYDVPLKDGTTEKHTVIDWTIAEHALIDEYYGWMSRDYIDYSDEAKAKAAVEKLLNTERFHAERCGRCQNKRYLSLCSTLDTMMIEQKHRL